MNKQPWETYGSNFLRQKTCGCRFRNYTQKDFIEDISFRTDVKLFGIYVNDTDKTEFICNDGHVFSASPNKIKQGRGCPVCKRQKLRDKFLTSKEDFIEKMRLANPSLELVGEFKGSHYPISYQCKICGNISTSLATKILSKESGCHYCNSSMGENIIQNFLQEQKIDFIRQKRFEGCVYKETLPFDFYLPQYNVCIEFQGEQHFKPVDFSYTPTHESQVKSEENFKKQQEKDRIKKEYCANNNIILLEITYKDKRKNKIEKILEDFLNNLIRNSNDCHT